MTSPLYHHGNLRETLLQHAEQVVATEGSEKLSLRELARVAGVSHGAPRTHFATREDLLEAVSLRGFDRLDDTLRAAVAGAGAHFTDRAMAVSRAYIRFVMQHPLLVELMYSQIRSIDDEALEEPPATKPRAYDHFERLLIEGQREGLIVSGPGDVVGLPYFAAIHGAAILLASGAVPIRQLDEVIANVTRYALRGIEVDRRE